MIHAVTHVFFFFRNFLDSLLHWDPLTSIGLILEFLRIAAHLVQWPQWLELIFLFESADMLTTKQPIQNGDLYQWLTC